METRRRGNCVTILCLAVSITVSNVVLIGADEVEIPDEVLSILRDVGPGNIQIRQFKSVYFIYTTKNVVERVEKYHCLSAYRTLRVYRAKRYWIWEWELCPHTPRVRITLQPTSHQHSEEPHYMAIM